jgi:hypothetical protein
MLKVTSSNPHAHFTEKTDGLPDMNRLFDLAPNIQGAEA